MPSKPQLTMKQLDERITATEKLVKEIHQSIHLTAHDHDRLVSLEDRVIASNKQIADSGILDGSLAHTLGALHASHAELESRFNEYERGSVLGRWVTEVRNTFKR